MQYYIRDQLKIWSLDVEIIVFYTQRVTSMFRPLVCRGGKLH